MNEGEGNHGEISDERAQAIGRIIGESASTSLKDAFRSILEDIRSSTPTPHSAQTIPEWRGGAPSQPQIQQMMGAAKNSDNMSLLLAEVVDIRAAVQQLANNMADDV